FAARPRPEKILPLPQPDRRESPKAPQAPIEAPKPDAPVKKEPPVPVAEKPAAPSEPPPRPAPPNPQPPVEPPPVPTPLPEPAKAPTITVVAVVDRVEGSVVLVGGPAESPVKAGQELHSGEGLECKGGRSGALLSYPDRTRLELEGDTRVRELLVREPGKGLRLFVERGAVKAEVSKQPAGQAMVFHSPHGEARVIGTTLRFQVDADPKKGTRLEVEEGKVELKNAAGRTVLVETGHVAVAAAGMALTTKRFAKDELLLSYDFEDGKKPPTFSKGTVQSGPDRRVCLAGDSETGNNSHVVVGDEGDGLFTGAGDEVLSFDYWVDAQAGSVNFHFWNSTKKVKHEAEVPKLVFGKWTHVTFRVADLGDPASRLKEGDRVASLYIQATGSSSRKFYIDNLVLTRPRSLKPRPVETK